MFSEIEKRFVEQASRFVDQVLRQESKSTASEPDNVWSKLAKPLSPILVEDWRDIPADLVERVSNAYYSAQGVAYLVFLNAADRDSEPHPLHAIVDQLCDALELYHPLVHPLENHPETVSRFGADGTVKIYDLPGRGGVKGYREQAETSEMFAMHHDGLGSGGSVRTVALYCDSAPLFGGYTCFQNIPLICLDLFKLDQPAFESLFLPDAITIIRPRGKGAIRVVTPVLFMNEQGLAQSFARVASGEYQVEWRSDCGELLRAKEFIETATKPFSPGSSFVHFTAPGHCCFIRNQQIAHSRTEFIDHGESGQVRVLSRKWFMQSSHDAVYKHVPGMFLEPELRQLLPTQCGEDLLVGEWQFDSQSKINRRMK